MNNDDILHPNNVQISRFVPPANFNVDNSKLQMHNYESADHAYIDRITREYINLSGVTTLVYGAHTEDGDLVYEEDDDILYNAPVKIKALFAPPELHTKLSKFGMDTKINTILIFHINNMIDQLGDYIKPADGIIIPYRSHKDVKQFRVIDAYEISNFRYNWQILAISVENFVGDFNKMIIQD